MRKGRPHIHDESSMLQCEHAASLDGSSLCLPMVAQGDAIGNFYLRAARGAVVDGARAQGLLRARRSAGAGEIWSATILANA